MTFNHLWINFKFSLMKVDGFTHPVPQVLVLNYQGLQTVLHKPTAPTTITAEINYIFIYLGSAFFTSFRKEVINNHEAAIPEGRHCKWHQHRYESRSIQDNHVYFRVYPDRRFFQ